MTNQTDQRPMCRLCRSSVLKDGDICLSCSTLRQHILLNPDLAVKILRELEIQSAPAVDREDVLDWYASCSAPSDYQTPDWDKYDRIHNWRNHIDEPIQDHWQSFSDDQKFLLAVAASSDASYEQWD